MVKRKPVCVEFAPGEKKHFKFPFSRENVQEFPGNFDGFFFAIKIVNSHELKFNGFVSAPES